PDLASFRILRRIKLRCRNTGHAASPPYLASSVIAPTRYPVARCDRRLFSSAANAERHCGSVAESGGCGEMRATGIPFLVMMIVSPCSAAAISCEKFWLASRTDISRMAPSCCTLQHRLLYFKPCGLSSGRGVQPMPPARPPFKKKPTQHPSSSLCGEVLAAVGRRPAERRDACVRDRQIRNALRLTRSDRCHLRCAPARPRCATP